MVARGSTLRPSGLEPLADSMRCGPYLGLRVIGRGGMGTVYEAAHESLDQRVAIKLMNSFRSCDPLANERFLREGEVVARVRHPHVVRVIEVGVEEGQPYIVMELLEGETLSAVLARETRLPLSRLVEIFMPVLSAVAKIHESRIIHRDLKAGNVMLARRPSGLEPVVLDFGISKTDTEAGDDSSLTHTDALLGTLPYLSPEQTSSAKAASCSSDQYALGVMLYECATGQRPFRGVSQYQLMHAILNAVAPPPSAHCPELPVAFDELVQRAMSRDPAARFGSVHELGGALLALGDGATWSRWAREFSSSAASVEARDRTESDSRIAFASPARARETPAAPAPARARPRRGALLAATLLLLALPGLAGALRAFGSQREPRVAAAQAPATSASERVSTPAPLPLATPSAPAADSAALILAPPVADLARPRARPAKSSVRQARSHADRNPLLARTAPNAEAQSEPGEDDAVNPFR